MYLPLDSTLPSHPKVMDLADALDMHPYDVCGRLFVFWCWAVDATKEGFIKPAHTRLLPNILGLTIESSLLTRTLLRTGWLDEVAEGYRIHAWEEHEGKILAARTRHAEAQARYQAEKDRQQAEREAARVSRPGASVVVRSGRPSSDNQMIVRKPSSDTLEVGGEIGVGAGAEKKGARAPSPGSLSPSKVAGNGNPLLEHAVTIFGYEPKGKQNSANFYSALAELAKEGVTAGELQNLVNEARSWGLKGVTPRTICTKLGELRYAVAHPQPAKKERPNGGRNTRPTPTSTRAATDDEWERLYQQTTARYAESG